jgi:hypothetical protein
LKLVNAIFANRRRQEEDLDGYLDDLRQSVDRLLVECEQYWSFSGDTPPPDDDLRAARIVAELHNINGLAVLLFERCPDRHEKTQREWIALWDSASGDDFKDPGRPPDPERFQQIAVTALALKRDVRARRNRGRSRWFD